MSANGRTKVMAVRRKLQNAADILDKTDGVSISYADKLACLSNLIHATDDLRHIMTGDEDYTRKKISQITVIWQDIGYGLEKKKYGVKMVLPAVLHRKAGNRTDQIKNGQAEKEYARRDLTAFLREEKERLGINESFMRDVVLVFTHVRTNKGLFDYDNLSTSPYINAVSDCFLSSDTARNIDFLQRFEQGEDNKTIVYIIKKNQFAEWSKNHY